MQLFQARGDFERADEMEEILDDDYANIDRDPISLEEGEETVLHYIMMQLSLKQGVKKWGERVEAGPMKEMTQLHGLEAFFPRDPKTLTREQRIKALSSLIFLKQKDSGEIKGRTCINGAMQHDYISKEEAAARLQRAPTVFS